MAYDSRTRTIAIDQSVSVPDVQAALGTTANDVATLCAHANINKWSRFKPIPDPRPGIRLDQNDNYRITQQNMIGAPIDSNGVQYALSMIGTCGIFVHAHNSIFDCINPAKCSFDWLYFGPMGKYYYNLNGRALTSNKDLWSAYRLGDFRGYKHNAVSPFPSYTFPQVVNKSGTTVSLTRNTNLTLYPGITPGIGTGSSVDTSVPGSLTLGELQMPNGLRLDKAYLCLILQSKTDKTSLMFCTGKQSGVKMEFEFKGGFPPDFTKNGATAYLAYVDQEIVWDGDTGMPANLLWVRHPDMQAANITFGTATEAAGVHIDITQDERGLPVFYKIIISVAEGMPAVTCKNNYIWFGSLGQETHKFPDKVPQEFTVSSNAPFTFSGQVIIANLDPKPSVMGVSLANGKYTQTFFFRQLSSGTIIGAI